MRRIRFSICIPPPLIAKVDEVAKRLNVSRSRAIEILITKGLGKA